MLTTSEIINKYMNFFEKRGHKRISNSSLIPENDPTTLFTSSGMQPLVPYLLGEAHPAGKRLVNVQNCFRAQDINEVGDNRHTTFFRMLGNWSLDDYFKKEQIPWFWEFLTEELNLPPERLYVTIFEGYKNIPEDRESEKIWRDIFEKEGLDPDARIFKYGIDKNWWSRVGVPDNMPIGEPGGPDTEVFYDFETTHDKKFGENCHINCDCGRYLEIGNSVFVQYKKKEKGFEELPQKNVDFGGGLERLLAVVEHKQDIFETSLFTPIIKSIEEETNKEYGDTKKQMRIITDHFIGAVFMLSNDLTPSNKEQGYILRRLIRRGLDNFYSLDGSKIEKIIKSIVEQYSTTDTILNEKFEYIKNTILEEQQKYSVAVKNAKKFIFKKYKKTGDELMGATEISADDAFVLYSTHGLSPTQIKSLGFTFNDTKFAQKMEEHQGVSRKGAEKKFAGGLADHSEKSIMGHTATHLLHQALRDALGDSVYQTGSNITSERIRFDFSYDKKLSSGQLKKVEDIVNTKIKENLPIHFEMLNVEEAKKSGAIGLFDEKYQDKVKVYFIGPSKDSGQDAYSKEFCGGPHVDFTGRLKRFKILKEEGLGARNRRIYSKVNY